MIYLIAFILALVGVFLNKRMTPGVRILFLVVILLYVIITLGLRYRVGIDSISYMMAYRQVPDLDHIWHSRAWLHRYEPGYILICSFCKTLFGNEFWPLQMVMETITNGCIFIFLYRYCRNVFVGLCVYFLMQWLYFSTEIMRESAAVAIFLVNFRNLEKKRWIAYYLVSLLSVLLHFSAIIIWFFPLVRYLRPNATYIVLCVLSLLATPMLILLTQVLPSSTVTARIDQYLMISEFLNMNWKYGEMIRAGLPAVALLVAYRMARLHSPMSHMLLLQFLFCCGAFAVPIIFSRFANYTTLFVTVALANFLSADTVRSWLRISLICFVLLTQSYYYYTMAPRWFPYVSVLNPRQVNVREQIWKKDFIYNHFW